MVNTQYAGVVSPSLLFGPDTYAINTFNIQNSSLREPTTAESISAILLHYQNLSDYEIFNLGKIQLGRVLRTPLGVVANPPRNENGLSITDFEVIKKLINGSEKISVGKGSIYLGEKDFGFAEYSSFKEGSQNTTTFAEGGLARILEHVRGTAEKLKQISNRAVYKDGVDISGFRELHTVEERIVAFGPFDEGYWLGVDAICKRNEDSGILFGIPK